MPTMVAESAFLRCWGKLVATVFLSNEARWANAKIMKSCSWTLSGEIRVANEAGLGSQSLGPFSR